MRVVFAGTPPFAATALEALLGAGHDVALVLTQPDRPSGRGLKLTPSAVSRVASERGLRQAKPESLRASPIQAQLREVGADVMVVAAYGLLLPQEVLEIPRLGCLNIHASLLPRWRGAAPVQRAILAGDAETGVGIMRMEAGLDTGPVLLEKRILIGPLETTGTLTDRLASLGAMAVVEALANLQSFAPRAQDPGAVTHAAKIARSDRRIDWTQPAEVLDRRVRAFNPVPGAETGLEGRTLKIWEARPVEGRGAPGRVMPALPGELVIACGSGALQVLTLQRPGSRRVCTPEFLRGAPIQAGSTLDP